jgi:ribose transport system ATP-binding protein
MFTQIRLAVTEKKAAIMISSDFSELVAMSDRIIVLREGRIVGELEGSEIDEQAIVRMVYSQGGETALSPATGGLS